MTYELRTYTANPGRIDDLLARFRDHTVELFRTHNMQSVGYWISEENPDVLVYLLRHEGDAEANWTAFRADEEWKSVLAASEAPHGKLTAGIETVYLTPTDFSALA